MYNGAQWSYFKQSSVQLRVQMLKSTTTLSHLLAHSMMSCLCEALSEGTSLCSGQPCIACSRRECKAIYMLWYVNDGFSHCQAVPSWLMTTLIQLAPVRYVCMHSISSHLLCMCACLPGTDDRLSLLCKLWGTVITVSSTPVMPCSNSVYQLNC